jgi:hypothetical protein
VLISRKSTAVAAMVITSRSNTAANGVGRLVNGYS